MNRICFLLLFGLGVVQGYAQDTLRLKFQDSETVKSENQLLGKDIYNNTYLREGDVLKKQGKHSTSTYKSKVLDSLTSVDISNPQEIMLFYKSKKTIVILSRELAERGMLEIATRFPSMETSYAASSAKRNYWLVNERNRSVNLYNTVTYELHRLFTFPEGKEIKEYFTLPHLFFWIDEEHVLTGYDLSGSEVLAYKLPSNYDNIQVLGLDKILYSYKDIIYFVDLKNDKVSVIGTSEKRISGFFYGNQKLSIFDGQKINNYFIKLP